MKTLAVRVLLAVVIVGVAAWCVVGVGGAVGAPGDLTQKADPNGCIVNDASPDITGCTNTGKALNGASSVTVSPDGTSAYVASFTSNAVAIFDRANDGTLTQKAGTAGCIVNEPSTDITGCDNAGKALEFANSVTVSPDGTSAYIASYLSEAVAVLDRELPRPDLSLSAKPKQKPKYLKLHMSCGYLSCSAELKGKAIVPGKSRGKASTALFKRYFNLKEKTVEIDASETKALILQFKKNKKWAKRITRIQRRDKVAAKRSKLIVKVKASNSSGKTTRAKQKIWLKG